MIAHKKEYALYKGDELLGVGTVEELSKELGIKKSTLHFYASPAYDNRLKELRKEKKLTQEELADIAEVSKRTYIYWENGERQIKPDKAQAKRVKGIKA